MEEFKLEPGERVLKSVRKHWFVFFVQLVPFALMAWLPTWIPGLLEGIATASPNGAALVGVLSLENAWFRFFLGLWWLVLWMLAFNTFTQYFLNHWVITSNRIVYIYQHGFFSREVSSFLLIRVQDVTTEVLGFFPTLLHYGNLIVQTASENSQHFRMTGIPNPTELRDLVMQLVADLHDDGKANESNIVRDIVNGVV